MKAELIDALGEVITDLADESVDLTRAKAEVAEEEPPISEPLDFA